MKYVAYNVETTRILKKCDTERGAKMAITKHCNKLGLEKEDYAVADVHTFHTDIEKSVERINLMSGKPYMERVNTPNCCSPASETYWSM